MIYFTADYHLFHRNILRYCERPFKTIQKMQQTIWKNHNNIVTPDDTVYFLGDLTMEGGSARQKLDPLFNKLNGNFIMILGNHDRLKPFSYLDMGFNSVHTSLTIELEGKKIFLCHDPAMVQIGIVEKDVGFAVCGHIHQLWKKVTCFIPVVNCGVDVWDFTPVSLQQILELIN